MGEVRNLYACLTSETDGDAPAVLPLETEPTLPIVYETRRKENYLMLPVINPQPSNHSNDSAILC
jgi:hypothetical protein